MTLWMGTSSAGCERAARIAGVSLSALHQHCIAMPIYNTHFCFSASLRYRLTTADQSSSPESEELELVTDVIWPPPLAGCATADGRPGILCSSRFLLAVALRASSLRIRLWRFPRLQSKTATNGSPVVTAHGIWSLPGTEQEFLMVM